MEIKELLSRSQTIWQGKCLLPEVIIRMGKVFGDICRYARNEKKDQALHTEQEIKKELGNMIFSSIRWCDDLGYDPEECIELAMKCQQDFPKG